MQSFQQLLDKLKDSELMYKNLLGQKVKNYQVVKFIGKGEFAHVYKAIDENDKKFVAMKVMLKSQIFRNPKRKELALAQIKILKECDNPNVMKYYESFQNNQFLFIITQFCNGGDLANLLLQKRRIPQDQAIVYIKQIVNGFKGLRQIDAVHRDFKAANVIIHDNVCKLADFGVSKQLEDDEVTKTLVGTVLTSPPELLDHKPYGVQADIWSIGIVFYQMIYGDYPFNAKTDFHLLEVIRERNIDYSKIKISQTTKDFIQRCLTIDPSKRITWEELFKHPLIGDRQPIKKKRTLLKNLGSIQTTNGQTIQKQVRAIPPLQKELQINNQINNEQKLKQQRQQFISLEKQYRSIIKNSIFVDNYIRPEIQTFQRRIRLNHSILLFILYKKTYEQLLASQKSLRGHQNNFNSKIFDSFVKSQHYSNVQQQLSDKLRTIKNRCLSYKSEIKVSSLDIQSQYDIDNSTYNLDQLSNLLILQYTQGLKLQIAHQADQKYKINMRKARNALMYYLNNNKKIDYEQYQKSSQKHDLTK